MPALRRESPFLRQLAMAAWYCLRLRFDSANVSVVPLRWHIGSDYRVAGLCPDPVVRVTFCVVLDGSAKTCTRASRWPGTARPISGNGVVKPQYVLWAGLNYARCPQQADSGARSESR